MRIKKEYQTKIYRLEKSINERLVKYCEENGVTQAHAQSRAIENWLTVKGA